MALLILALRGADTQQRDKRSTSTSRPTIERFVVGTGATAAVVVRRRSPEPQPAVIFLHGWQLVGPDAYRDWFTHLARRGATVIAPRYQLRRGTAPDDALDNALAGIRAALQRVSVRTDDVTVAGHSAGGALAADYAAVAAAQDLPPARRVLVIYPGRAIRGSVAGIPAADLSQIPSTTRLVVMASASDEVVGDAPARALIDAATAIPPERRTFVSTEDPAAAAHFAPVLASRARPPHLLAPARPPCRQPVTACAADRAALGPGMYEAPSRRTCLPRRPRNC